jgi:hypothetical protein
VASFPGELQHWSATRPVAHSVIPQRPNQRQRDNRDASQCASLSSEVSPILRRRFSWTVSDRLDARCRVGSGEESVWGSCGIEGHVNANLS